jgi:hypothetical protein
MKRFTRTSAVSLAALAGSTLLAVPAASAAAPTGGDLAPLPPPPTLVASLEVSCTEQVPVPTVTAHVTNTGGAEPTVVVRRNGLIEGDLTASSGETTSETIVSPYWEDKDNHFDVVTDGQVLASLDHHFDCLHPVIDVVIGEACAGVQFPVEVTNSGHEGTQVSVSSDGMVTATPAVAPGHTTVVDVTADAGTLVQVHHQGTLHAEVVVADCAEPTPGSPHAGAGSGLGHPGSPQHPADGSATGEHDQPAGPPTVPPRDDTSVVSFPAPPTGSDQRDEDAEAAATAGPGGYAPSPSADRHGPAPEPETVPAWGLVAAAASAVGLVARRLMGPGAT